MSNDASTPPAQPAATEPTATGPTPPTRDSAGAADERPPAQRSTRTTDPLRGSRTSGIWAAVVALGVLLILLVVFIAQNTQTVSVAFLGWEGQTPLSVALLIAAAAGLFLAAAAGTLRILQLRRRVRRDKRG